jgi:hypothetical protein
MDSSLRSKLFFPEVESFVGRLLARILKEGVQFWYNDTSTVKRGGVRENVPLENL